MIGSFEIFNFPAIIANLGDEQPSCETSAISLLDKSLSLFFKNFVFYRSTSYSSVVPPSHHDREPSFKPSSLYCGKETVFTKTQRPRARCNDILACQPDDHDARPCIQEISGVSLAQQGHRQSRRRPARVGTVSIKGRNRIIMFSEFSGVGMGCSSGG